MNTGDTIFAGRGEFQIKDIYVCADVKVLAGIINEVNFSSPSGVELEEADATAKQLVGQPVARALEVTAKESDSEGDHPSESPKMVALLEAFHRAVEACFDSE